MVLPAREQGVPRPRAVDTVVRPHKAFCQRTFEIRRSVSQISLWR